jgi:hypothetical protein
MKHTLLAAVAVFTLLLPTHAQAQQTSTNEAPCNLSGFLAVQHAHANRAEVTLCGTVTRVNPVRYSRRGGGHRVFVVDVGHRDSIEIDANVDIMGDFPIKPGDTAIVRGEYYYDFDGREGVHWTHRGDGGHPGGFVILNDHRYE